MDCNQLDREPAQVEFLTGQQVEPVLRAALRRCKHQLRRWQVHSVHHRPGAGVTVGYSVQALNASGVRVSEYLCATTAALPAATLPQLQTFTAADLGVADLAPVHVWQHPADPCLPALADACTPARLSRRLGRQVTAKMVAYRPTRRAVVRVGFADDTFAYAKVFAPQHYADFAARFNLLQTSGAPIPRVLRLDKDGLLLAAQAEGKPLSALLAQGMSQAEAEAVFNALVQALVQLPAAALQLPRHPAWCEQVQYYAYAAAAVLPDQAQRAHALARAVAHLLAVSDPGEVVPTHGDFYEANVLLAGGRVQSLLDVDALGPGYRVDDLACLLGHVSVLPHLAPEQYPRVAPILETWTRLACAQVDPVALCARCAGIVLSLVAGAKRVGATRWRADALGRLAQAENWLARAQSMQARRSR